MKLWTVASILIGMLVMTRSYAQDEIPSQSRWEPRPIGRGELKEHRGEIEDRLRAEILGAFPDDQFQILRDVLNRPWDVPAVKYLGNLILTNAPADGEVRISGVKWTAIANMLAYIGKNRPQPDVTQEVKRVFDELFLRAIVLDKKGRLKENFWGNTTAAVARYGTAELLSESFWKGVREGLPAAGALESVGNTEVLNHLRGLLGSNQWPENSRTKEHIQETISIMEMQFEYPELKSIKDRTARLHIGRMLQGMKDGKAEQIEKLAEQTDNEEVRQVLARISTRLQKRPSLQIEGVKVSTQADAERIAFEAYAKKMHAEILPNEGVQDIAIVTLGYDVRDFAKKGERIWEARVMTDEGRLRAIIWVNPRSEKVHFVCGPWE